MEEQLKTQKSLSICVNHLTFLHNIIRQNHPVYVMQGGPLKVSPTFLLARLKGQICVGRQHLSVRRPSRGHISTSSSAVAKGPRDALCLIIHSRSLKLIRNDIAEYVTPY